ncbi:hypothetical protein N0O92_04825 [Alkalihalobacillus sp. MEB130]|uniref:hypothetical protein n=1 Tax=Alkalihalobacillus sp. MEB130 TaxID=2976704 RepID=UPI0028DF4DC0|nr:hypothetical protein [Alkalihalobacillus sp. MEB130]MDT8859548.1 hypothetical protein [Alkalihalobacillus sp. MEB130]
MLFLLLLVLLAGGLLIGGIQRIFIRKENPDIEQLWAELDQQEWFKQLIEQPERNAWVVSDKESGLLQDPYFCKKILEKEVHRDMFIKYITEKTTK